MTSIGERIKNARLGLDLTQAEIAETVGVTPQAVAQWESGATNPGIDGLSILAARLNTSVEWIVTGNPNNAPVAQRGWLCPGCGRGVSPWKDYCDHGGVG